VSGTWPRRRLKHVVDINSRSLPETTKPDAEFRYVDISACGRGALVGAPEPMQFAEAPSRARRLVQEGDTIVSTVRTYLRAVWPVTGPSDDLVVSTGFAVLSPRAKFDPRFLGWLMQSDLVIEEIVARSVGVSYPAINGLEIGNLEVPVPSQAEQRAIADYLDAETARIDAVLTARRRQRELLIAFRRSVLDGLTVPRALGGQADRDGEWPVVPLKRTAAFFADGDWIESPFITTEGIRLIQTGNVGEGEYREQGFRYVTEETFSSLACTEVLTGDVLVSRLAGPVGCACLAPALGEKMIASVDVVIMRPVPGLDPAFAVFYLSSTYHLALAELLARGTTMQRLSRSQVGEMPIPLPSIEVQRKIVEEINRRLVQVKALSQALNQQIDALTERRQALVTAAVTGQLEIPGVAA